MGRLAVLGGGTVLATCSACLLYDSNLLTLVQITL